MELSELSLWIARLAVLFFMYLLIVLVIFALRADAHAASESPYPVQRPAQPIPVTPPKPMTTQKENVRSLLVRKGTVPVGGREYQLFGPIDIGRGSDCQISIPNHFVSTHHARVFSSHERWMVEDLGSTNGTYVNDLRIDEPQPLNHGDRIMVGDTEFVIQ